MSHLYRFVLCLLLFAAGITNVHAQQYPVTASTQIIPPYSVYLPDYAVAGSDKLRVILVQNDLTLPSYNIRLRMTVEQNGTVIMRTAAMFNPKPLSLSAGIPTIIGGIDLADYLNPANIEYSGGFSRDQYEKTRSLPEGAYRISFTAFDYSRPQVQVSNMGSNVFFFRKSDPPLLNLPICNSRVEKLDPQFLTFNWSSRNSPNPLPGSGTEYVFSLYEVRPAGSNPDYILRSAKPIYTLVTETNTIVYGPGEPQLRDSMQYVWVVQARDKSGRDMFSNQGLSQSCTFTYLGNNPFTQGNIQKPVLKGRATGERSLRFNWDLADAGYNVEAYRLQYRAAKTGDAAFDWQTEEKAGDTALSVNSLEPGRAYQGRLQWKIAGIYGPYSDVLTVRTDSAKTFVCGDAGRIPVPTNKEPLTSLSAGKIIRVGNFDIILTEAKGGNGKFSGKGRVITFGFGTGLQMEFKDISINTDMVVTAGNVYAATEGIGKFVNDKLDEQHGGNDVGDVKTGDIIPDITTKLKIFTPANIKVNTGEGTITLKDSETGQEEVINYKDKGKTLPLVLEADGGYLYNIDKEGKVTPIGKRDHSITPQVLESLKNLQPDKGTVTFTAGQGNVYGFDAWQGSYAGKEIVEREYESLAGSKYRVSAKAIVPGEQEEVIATLTNAASGITASKLKFVTGKGIVPEAKDNGNNSFTIRLTGGPGGDAQEIYAIHPDGKGGYSSLGKLLVVSYKPLQKKLVLVPVGAKVTIPEQRIKTALQQAYGKAGITYTVQVDESFRYNKTWDSNGDSVLQDKGSAFLSNNFTGEEKALNKAYKKASKIDDDAAYLFLVDEAALSDGDLAGKMPRESQFGFVFTKGAAEANVVRTVVHEIGHGDYTLEHTFAAVIGLESRSTDNLMDYGNGFGLLKYQWDILHDPGHVWGVFDDDGGSENYINRIVNKEFINKDNKTVSFLTPAGTVLALPFDRLGRVEFQYGAVYNDGKDLNFGPELTVGALRSFELLNNSTSRMERYFYDDNEGKYGNLVTAGLFVQEAGPESVDGFVYPVQTGGKLTLYKFTRAQMPLYQGGEPKKKFIEFADVFKPFGVNDIIKNAKGDTIRQVLASGASEKCLACINKLTISMMADHWNQPEYLWVDKIAQMRHIYPEYFSRFTQPEQLYLNGEESIGPKGIWEAPEDVFMLRHGDDFPTTDNASQYVWANYLEAHASVKALYRGDKHAKEQFFRTFYTEFVNYIATASAADDEFWENLVASTPVEDVMRHAEKDPAFQLQTIPVGKKALGLKIMTSGYSTLGKTYVPYLRLLNSFKPAEYKEALIYIEKNIGVEQIYKATTAFWEPEEAEIGALMMLSNMITSSGYYDNKVEEKADQIDNPGSVPQMEADMLQFKNTDVEFTGPNLLTIEGKEYKYNDIVSIRIAGSFTVGDKTFAKGNTLTIPAIQVALMSKVTNAQVTEKTAWLAFDVGTMVLGVGSAKILFSAGNYVRKAIVAADLIGSAAGIGLQLLDNDAISDDMRAALQIACLVSSLPNMATAIPKIEKLVSRLDDVMNDARNASKVGKTAKEIKKMEDDLKALEEVRNGLSNGVRLVDVEDMAELERRVLSVSGNRTNDVAGWLKNTKSANDKNIYLVVHADGSKFKVMHNGQDIEMTHRSLANWIRSADNIPADGQLVLLSCVDIETAQHLSRNLGRSLIANDGPVNVYKNGLIEADNGFKYIDNAGNIDNSKTIALGRQEPPVGDMVQLGKTAVRSGSLADVARRFGIGGPLAARLIQNADFVTACLRDSRFMNAIVNALPEVKITIGSKAFTTYKQALLTAFADNPEFFSAVYKQMKEVEAIMKNTSLSTADFKELAARRVAIKKLFENAGFEANFFANGLFNSTINNHIPLDGATWAKIDDARKASGIAVTENVLVSDIYMKGSTSPGEATLTIIAGSGKKGAAAKEVKDVSGASFEQFAERVQDSESKFFEYLWKRLSADNDLKVDDINEIVLYSERPMCLSCANALRLFKEVTGIKIIVHEGKYVR